MKLSHSRFFMLLVVLMLGISSCHVGRFFYWNFADVKDYKRFPSVPVEQGSDVFTFYSGVDKNEIGLPGKYLGDDGEDNLTVFLDDHKTLAFLIIRNDTLLYESYFSDYADTSIMPSFSVSKVFISALVGIAIDEGFVTSVKQPIIDFIPELLLNDPRFGEVSVEGLLNMRSGIRFNEGYTNPFADMAKYYYGTNLRKYVSKLKMGGIPDESYDYISVNTLLLAIILERSTEIPLNDYLSQKLWQPMQMEFDASWNIDSKKDGQIKAFCCLNARARDFAKFGRLYLNNGNWEGEQLVPSAWVEKSMSVINDSRDSQGYAYTYQWRVKEDGAIFAKGVLGQYIYVDPTKNVIIVRMGKKATKVVWADFFEEICGEL